ncbi:MAG: hypothetical protein V4675_12935 [Verrucomicrobiota bacterium]
MSCNLKLLPVPRHCQDTEIHCGYGCATMMLDWMGAGAVYEKAAGTGDLSQIAMHTKVGTGDGWFCSPSTLTALLNEDAGAVGGSPPRTPSATLPAVEVMADSKAGSIVSALDYMISAGRPAVLLQTAGPGSGVDSHWLVVCGKSMLGDGTAGFFLLDPWIPGQNPAYDESECYKTLPNVSGRFAHTRGASCTCPQWIPRTCNPFIRQEWAAAHLTVSWLEQRVLAAAKDGICYAILYGTSTEISAAKAHQMSQVKFPEVNSSGSLKVKFPAGLHLSPLVEVLELTGPGGSSVPVGLKTACSPSRPRLEKFHAGHTLAVRPAIISPLVKALELAGLAGPDAPAEWQKARSSGRPGVEKVHGGHLLAVWPEAAGGTRLAAWFGDSGDLLGAAILEHWPDLITPAAMEIEFKKHGAKWCQDSQVPLPPAGASLSVLPELYWENCAQSAVVWWPFYVVRIFPLKGPGIRLLVDLNRRVYSKLTSNGHPGA